LVWKVEIGEQTQQIASLKSYEHELSEKWEKVQADLKENAIKRAQMVQYFRLPVCNIQVTALVDAAQMR
jgi:hypothetical protein